MVCCADVNAFSSRLPTLELDAGACDCYSSADQGASSVCAMYCWCLHYLIPQCLGRLTSLLQLQVSPWVYFNAESQDQVASRKEAPFLEAVKAALQQATQSYAPYSHCPSGLAIATAGGAVYSGPYLESAAFNPSLGPLQAAVIDAVTDGIAYYTEVWAL